MSYHHVDAWHPIVSPLQEQQMSSPTGLLYCLTLKSPQVCEQEDWNSDPWDSWLAQGGGEARCHPRTPETKTGGPRASCLPRVAEPRPQVEEGNLPQQIK